MKCPRCDFTTFDEATECKKCGLSFTETYAPEKDIPFNKLKYATSTKNIISEPERKNRIGIFKRSIALFIDMCLIFLGGIMTSIVISLRNTFNQGITARTILQEINKALHGLINRIIGAKPEAMLGIIIGIIITSLIVNLIFTLSYNLIEGLTGASPGKRIMRIKIYNNNGFEASIIQLLLRYFIKNIPFICLLIALFLKNNLLHSLSQILGAIILFGCLSALGNRRQALHDLLVGTAVFSKAD